MRRHRRKAPKVQAPTPEAVEIKSLGAGGDGLSTLADGTRLYVEGALPGETVIARPFAKKADGWAADVQSIETASPDRVPPPCPHAAACGGCQLQHVNTEAQTGFKQGLIEDALAKRGLGDVSVGPLIIIPAGERRRLDLGIKAGRLGLKARRSHLLVEIEDCLLQRPKLRALIQPLRGIVSKDWGEGRILLTEADNGIDMLVTSPLDPDLALREALAAFAADQGITRLSWRRSDRETPEPMIVLANPTLALSEATITLPPGPFLQASRKAEDTLVAKALELAGPPPKKSARALDLFAGIGPFALALARAKWSVLAVEVNEPALRALKKAAGSSALGGRITTETRDLDRRSLEPAELKTADLALFDPSRAGAAAQAEHLAVSSIPTIIAVSCNPKTFARDARILVDGGYRLEAVTPVDAFVHSAHVEVIAKLCRT
ncbi:MAG: class I SAM-dependent RNA methyltransferase [Magnetovibrionaceae bacterium]